MKQDTITSEHKVDLSKLNYDQLKALIEDASVCLDTLRQEKIKEAKDHALEVAKQFDLSIEDLFPDMRRQPAFMSQAGSRAPRADAGKKRKEPEFVYRHPDEAGVFYKGLGKNPAWFKEMSNEDKEASKIPFDPEIHGKK